MFVSILYEKTTLFIPSNILIFSPVVLFAQTTADTTTAVVTLKQSIDFAIAQSAAA
jgi:hypothetical protein